MKAEEIVTAIAKSQEYSELVELWKLVQDEPGPGTESIWGRIYELLRFLEEVIDAKKKAFLIEVSRSCIKNTKPNTIYFTSSPNVIAAQEAFARQINEQMPIYIVLADLMQAKKRAEKQRKVAVPI